MGTLQFEGKLKAGDGAGPRGVCGLELTGAQRDPYQNPPSCAHPGRVLVTFSSLVHSRASPLSHPFKSKELAKSLGTFDEAKMGIESDDVNGRHAARRLPLLAGLVGRWLANGGCGCFYNKRPR